MEDYLKNGITDVYGQFFTPAIIESALQKDYALLQSAYHNNRCNLTYGTADILRVYGDLSDDGLLHRHLNNADSIRLRTLTQWLAGIRAAVPEEPHNRISLSYVPTTGFLPLYDISGITYHTESLEHNIVSDASALSLSADEYYSIYNCYVYMASYGYLTEYLSLENRAAVMAYMLSGHPYQEAKVMAAEVKAMTVKQEYITPLMEAQDDNIDSCHETKMLSDSKEQPYEMVNHPSHYNRYSYETIEMMRRIYGYDDTIKWCEMTAFKYRMRMGTKPISPVQEDLDKEEWYLKMRDNLIAERNKKALDNISCTA